MSRSMLITLLVLPALAGSPAGAADPPDHSAGMTALRRCTVEYSRTTLLGSPMPGILQECRVQPGDTVKAGQLLGRLQDGDARAEMERFRAEAETDTTVRVSEARFNRSVAKLKASESLHRRKFLSEEEFNLDRLDMEMNRIGIEEAKHKRLVARLQFEQAAAMVRFREFVSPHDGVVVEVLKNEGESAALNEPIFRIVNTERMRITGQLDVGDAWRVRKGQAVRIWPEVEGAEVEAERESFTGRVVFVDSRIDPETQTCKVVAEVDNHDQLLRSGLLARMEILPRAAEAKPPVTGSTAPAPTPAPAGGAGAEKG